jgi:CheY-like chemotaxis protein
MKGNNVRIVRNRGRIERRCRACHYRTMHGKPMTEETKAMIIAALERGDRLRQFLHGHPFDGGRRDRSLIIASPAKFYHQRESGNERGRQLRLALLCSSLSSEAVPRVAAKSLCTLLYFSMERIPLVSIIHPAGSGRVERLQELLVVLVIEDDQDVQIVIEEALSDAGFEPAIAPSGEEAVTLLKGGKTKYCALVTDINLRGTMDGWEVAKQARQVDPAFPIVYMTGAPADQWASHGVPNSVLLIKPFAPAQLVTAVSQLLNAIPPTAPTQ